MEDCAEHLARIQQGKPSYLWSTLKPRKTFLQRERRKKEQEKYKLIKNYTEKSKRKKKEQEKQRLVKKYKNRIQRSTSADC